jgi:hypothetical protein
MNSSVWAVWAAQGSKEKSASALISFYKKELKFFFFGGGVKIGCHSRFIPECNTERSFIDSLYIALGENTVSKVHIFKVQVFNRPQKGDKIFQLL